MATIQQYYSVASAHNGKWLASGEIVYLSTESGVSQIWKANPKTGETQQLTFFQERVMKLYVTPAGDQILFAMDKGGNEQEQLHVLDLATGKSRPLTDNDKARHQLGGVLPDGKTVVFSCNGRNSANFDICALNMDEGAVRIHGGGFGGSIQAFVPLDRVDTFVSGMDGWLGAGNCRVYRIASEGAYAAWL